MKTFSILNYRSFGIGVLSLVLLLAISWPKDNPYEILIEDASKEGRYAPKSINDSGEIVGDVVGSPFAFSGGVLTIDASTPELLLKRENGNPVFDVRPFFFSKRKGVVVIDTIPESVGWVNPVSPGFIRPGKSSYVTNINKNGKAVGRFSKQVNLENSTTFNAKKRVFVWDDQIGMRDIFDAWVVERPYINNNDVVVANLVEGLGSMSKIVVRLWSKKEGVAEIDELAGFRALAINGKNQIVGFSKGESEHAFIWSEEVGVVALDPPGVDSSRAISVNENGAVLIAAKKVDHEKAFIWSQEDGFLEISSLSGGGVLVHDINDCGAVVGGFVDGSGNSHAFIWDKNRGMKDIGSPFPGEVSSIARGINNHGQAVMEVWVSGGWAVDMWSFFEEIAFPEKWKPTGAQKMKQTKVVIWNDPDIETQKSKGNMAAKRCQ